MIHDCPEICSKKASIKRMESNMAPIMAPIIKMGGKTPFFAPPIIRGEFVIFFIFVKKT